MVSRCGGARVQALQRAPLRIFALGCLIHLNRQLRDGFHLAEACVTVRYVTSTDTDAAEVGVSDGLLEKVWQGERIDQAEALALWRQPLEDLGALANRRR